ncbi:unnamed protein product [marine sediment metagenome]|uniref:LmbE family protein n=1 Tax=marine sediment metagenome TaxID=412755 RepID=X0YKZ8_9ZZZZ
MNFKRVLVLSPHTDDGELGAGGTIARFLEEGSEVHYVAFSAPIPKLEEECVRSLKMLSAENNRVNITILRFERRNFPENRQKILDFMYEYNQKIKPDLVLTPSLNDKHQDHETVTKEAIRAFKDSTIFGYILRWNCRTIKEDILIGLEEHHIQSKIAAASQYYSQFKLRKKYFSPDYHRFEAYVRGLNLPSHYAEAFELIQLKIPMNNNSF